MAYETGINQIALRIAEVIHRFARSKGWAQKDYHVFMKYRPDYYILNVLVVAKAFDGRTEQQESTDYHDLRDAIRAEAEAELNAINDLGLVLTGFEELDRFWPPRLKPSEIEIDEKLINQGVSWSDPSHQVAH